MGTCVRLGPSINSNTKHTNSLSWKVWRNCTQKSCFLTSWSTCFSFKMCWIILLSSIRDFWIFFNEQSCLPSTRIRSTLPWRPTPSYRPVFVYLKSVVWVGGSKSADV